MVQSAWLNGDLSQHQTTFLPLIVDYVPKLFSYVVARDFGFAPNPFYQFCTLATCKPEIRRSAQVGDWVAGTGSKSRSRSDRLVYVMRVTETMSFDDYWDDPRFEAKRPNLYSSRRKAFGDNIYHRASVSGEWVQSDSHHSFPNGVSNPRNTVRDTRVNRVLVSDDFVYWGGNGPAFPFFAGKDIRQPGQAHRCRFPQEVVDEFIAWIRRRDEKGYSGTPTDWR